MAILATEDVVTTKMAVEEVVSEYLFQILRLYVQNMLYYTERDESVLLCLKCNKTLQ
jgi:hypothetical protein